jgi:hypothetical protein
MKIRCAIYRFDRDRVMSVLPSASRRSRVRSAVARPRQVFAYEVQALLSRARAMARAVAGIAEALGGAAARIIDALAPYLAQAMVAQRGGEG